MVLRSLDGSSRSRSTAHLCNVIARAVSHFYSLVRQGNHAPMNALGSFSQPLVVESATQFGSWLSQLDEVPEEIKVTVWESWTNASVECLRPNKKYEGQLYLADDEPTVPDDWDEDGSTELEEVYWMEAISRLGAIIGHRPVAKVLRSWRRAGSKVQLVVSIHTDCYGPRTETIPL